nr:D-2-hydroxyacid dehydrogenase [uncultured Gemmiger sp.]
MKRILVALPLNEEQQNRLRHAAPEAELKFSAQPEEADILWADVIMGNVPVASIRKNDHLEWFQSNFAGPDPYLVPGVLPENCAVTNATGAYGLAISEWMLGMWLGLCKDLFLYRDRQNRCEWNAIERPVRSVAGARVLCVGLGDIGSSFARRAHAMGAQVVGVRRHAPDTCPSYCVRVVGQKDLDAELPQADLVALSLPGTDETAHMFDAARIARMKPGAILMNVGRGTAVDTDALTEALRSGHLFGAALDVTDPEPLPADHPLWKLPNAFITPHISGRFSLPRTLDNIVDIFARNLRHYLNGETLDNQVSRSTHYVSDDTAGQRLRCEPDE